MHKESIDITLTEVGGGESVVADWRGSCVVAQIGQTAAVPGAETGLRVCGQAGSGCETAHVQRYRCLADLRRFFNVVEIYISLRTGNRNEAARLTMSQFCNVALVETLDGLDRA